MNSLSDFLQNIKKETSSFVYVCISVYLTSCFYTSHALFFICVNISFPYQTNCSLVCSPFHSSRYLSLLDSIHINCFCLLFKKKTIARISFFISGNTNYSKKKKHAIISILLLFILKLLPMKSVEGLN